MKSNENTEINKNLENLKTGMINYLEFGNPEYSKKDVEKCISLIDSFLSDIAQSKNKETGMKFVEKLILKLNNLNAKCAHELIETDQREQIAHIIISAGHLKGYNRMDEDVTEEWREW